MKKCFALLLALVLCFSLTTCGLAQEAARSYGSRIIGMTATITMNGVIKTAPDSDAPMAGRIYEGETYTVLGYMEGPNSLYWLLIEWQPGWSGWIGSGVTQLSGTADGKPEGCGFVVITGDGVRCRRGPGTAYERVSTCTVGNGYRVLEVAMGDTGKNWYRICVDGVSCWVSSGMCTFYSYD